MNKLQPFPLGSRDEHCFLPRAFTAPACYMREWFFSITCRAGQKDFSRPPLFLFLVSTSHPPFLSHFPLLPIHLCLAFVFASRPPSQEGCMPPTHILRTLAIQALQDTSDPSTPAEVATSRPLPPLIVCACHQRRHHCYPSESSGQLMEKREDKDESSPSATLPHQHDDCPSRPAILLSLRTN